MATNRFTIRLLSALAIITIYFFNTNSVSAQLRIYQGLQQTGTFEDCVVNTIYKGTTIPGGLDNQIASIRLTKGYMATLAENEDGTGNSYPFMAVTSDVSVNLNSSLRNKVSFIRVLPLRNTLKKGAGFQDNNVINQLNVSWFYDWGPNDVTTTTREYALMAWGRNAANTTNVNNYIAKTDITHLLSFNEPDNIDQSNIPVADAVPLHRNLQATGYRLGSPAPTESEAQSNKWLGNFMNLASANNVRVDYVAIHWYDWGSWLQTGNVNPNPQDVFNRFKSYVNNIYNTYKKPIWITEFNANRNTSEQTHIGFINLALPWLESQTFIERYAYFFPPALQPVDVNGNLTPIGTAYSNFSASTPAITTNAEGTPSTISLEAEDATLTGVTTITNCTSGSGGQIVPAISGTQRVTFNNVSVASAGNYKLKIFYYSKGIARNINVKINANPVSTIAIPATSGWCYENVSAGSFETTVALSSGNNTIEFSEAPILDKIEVIETLGTLPISLTDFSAEVKDYGIKLNWQTAQEINNQYFEILKADTQNEFKAIAKINGAGNTNSPKFYSFTDFNPQIGANYYQLKQYDTDGKSESFAPVAVNFGFKADELKLLQSTETSVSISATASKTQNALLSYLAIDGKILYQKNVVLQIGLNTFNIPVSKSSSAIGIIHLITDRQQSIKIAR
ncbi:glycosyl hydrolase [Pedobacter puniceum]|uniref:Carbohydrate-binding protein n=1 Tax=Pedobacter puniceum TaxID=2666136 RepID=A0A7K0FP26_9SPHI|nr:glycosyl hydrolase [Pedobacter puniceum]MRX47000.1 carbohydrate-binding protein [Pedobacter puniceum]